MEYLTPLTDDNRASKKDYYVKFIARNPTNDFDKKIETTETGKYIGENKISIGKCIISVNEYEIFSQKNTDGAVEKVGPIKIKYAPQLGVNVYLEQETTSGDIIITRAIEAVDVLDPKFVR